MKILVIKPMEELLITLMTCFITLFNQTEIRRCTEKRFQVTKLLLSLLFVSPKIVEITSVPSKFFIIWSYIGLI